MERNTLDSVVRAGYALDSKRRSEMVDRNLRNRRFGPLNQFPARHRSSNGTGWCVQ